MYMGGEKGTGREMKGRERKREGKWSYQYFFSQVQALNYGHTMYMMYLTEVTTNTSHTIDTTDN